MYRYPINGPQKDPHGNVGAQGGEGIFLGHTKFSSTFVVGLTDGSCVETRSIMRKESVAQSSEVAVKDEKQTELLPGLLYGNSEELCVVAADAAGIMPQWTEFCDGNVAKSGASLLSKLSGLRASMSRPLLQEPVLMEAPRLQASSKFSGSAAEVKVRKLTQSPLQLRFEFFDGINWKAEWDSVLTQSLPRAIRVTILSRSKKQTNAVLKQHVSTLLLDNPSIE